MDKDIGKEIREEYGDSGNNKKMEEIQRITVSKQGQEALTAIVERINDGFMGGKINRTQAVNWIMLRFHEELTDADIKEIRAEHFDEIAVLEALLRQAKESGKVPSEFKALLQKQMENYEQPKKKSKKALT
jgi:hypothetical protein